MSFRKFYSKCILENRFDALESFPKLLLDKYELPLVDFSLNYGKEYGALPSKEVVLSEIDDSEIFFDDNVKDNDVNQLLAEAKRKNYEREVIEAMSKERNSTNPDFIKLADRISKLHKTIGDSGFVSFHDDSLYIPPKSRLRFKYKSLENNVKSILNGELCVFVAPEKSGKTWIMLDIALDAFLNQHKRVYFTSLELNKTETQKRINALIGGFNPIIFREDDREALVNAKRMYQEKYSSLVNSTNGSFIIPKHMTKTIGDIIRDVETYEPDVVFVDSVYMLQDGNGRSIEGDWAAISSAVGQLKSIAREKDIQVVCNSQLVRNPSANLDTSDIAFSHSFSRVSDIVIGMLPENDNLDVVMMKVIASRVTKKNAHNWVEFNWDECKITEKKSNLIKNFEDERIKESRE